MPNRRTVLRGASAGLVAGLAGCTDWLGDDGRTADGDRPDPYTESGTDLNESPLRSDHEAALRSEGSFAATQELSVNGPDREFESTSNYRIDLNAGAFLRRSESSLHDAEATAYTDGSGTYTRWNPDDGEPSHSSGDPADPVDPVEAMGRNFLIVDGVAFEQAGVEEYEGLWVTRYEASGADAVETAAHGDSDYNSEEISAFEATLLVTPDGIVVSNEFSITFNGDGGETHIEYAHSVDDIGAVTVEEPSWLSEAK